MPRRRKDEDPGAWDDAGERAWLANHGLEPGQAPVPFDRERFWKAVPQGRPRRRWHWPAVAVAAAAALVLGVRPDLFSGAAAPPGPPVVPFIQPHWGASTIGSLASQAAQQAGSLRALPMSYVATTERQALAWSPALGVNQVVGGHPVYVAVMRGHFSYRTVPLNAVGRKGHWLVMVVGRINGSIIATALLPQLPAPLARLGHVVQQTVPAVAYPPLTDGPVVCPPARELGSLPPSPAGPALAALNQYRAQHGGSSTPPLAAADLAYSGPAAHSPYGLVVRGTCGSAVLHASWAITWGHDPSLAATAFLIDSHGHWRLWSVYP